ncbi:family 43 glycosylhydrolase, partial [Vibrio parahaemolyticus]|nr:family 43 glycosylhydrolase [Vibrio parahaemolyticus]
MTDFVNPIIEQRADPHIYKHTDGYYYFTASVPEYDRIEIRRAKTIAELDTTSELINAWYKPDTGPYSDLIWAPELHFIDNAWYVYF